MGTKKVFIIFATSISVDLSHGEIFRAKVGKGSGIMILHIRQTVIRI